MKRYAIKTFLFVVLVAAGSFAAMAGEPSVDEICSEVESAAGVLALRQASLKDLCSLLDYAAETRRVNGTNVWTAALQKALDEHEIVRIPSREEPYFIDGVVTVPSNRRIEAKGATIRLVNGVRTLLLRNRNAADGSLAPIAKGTRDCNIAVIGGRWEDWSSHRLGYGGSGRFGLGPRQKGSFYGVSTLFYFGNADCVWVSDVTFSHCSAFAVQAGDGIGHVYEQIRFDHCFADGIHLNGNLERVWCRDLRGKVGDDLVALNAYDWLNSSVNFGPQRAIVCEDLELQLKDGQGYPAIRILPAKYRYADGTVVDCSIRDIVFRRVKGITTFKMYLQTPCYEIGKEPEWGEVGSGGNLHFEDLDIDLAAPIDLLGGYASSDPLRGHYAAFEFGANLTSVDFRNVRITFHLDRYPLGHLAIVGPKSSRLPAQGKRPAMEVFDPYVSCRVARVTVEGLKIEGKRPQELVRATVFDDINCDGRSSGKGVIDKLEIKE